MTNRLYNLLRGEGTQNLPNAFTIEMGKLIKRARVHLNLSQAELADRSYFTQASISLVEAGKREVTSSELLALSSALSKPVLYFFPGPYRRYFEIDKVSPTLQELLLVAQDLSPNDLETVIIQARALSLRGRKPPRYP